MDAKKIYDKAYYESHLGDKYERSEAWMTFFGRIADRIVNEIGPKTVMDVGCAKGFLVEALRDRGVEAYGIDISEYAISEVRGDIKPYCKVASASEELDRNYDLITCIEVFEHMETEMIYKACANFCRHSDDILFSSTPFDYNEETHINVKPVECWVELFWKNGFLHDLEYDASYISVQSLRFKRQKLGTVELLKFYERKIFQDHQQIFSLRNHLELAQERIRVMDLGNIEHGQEIDRMRNACDKKILEAQKKYELREENLKNNCKDKLECYSEQLEDAFESNIALGSKIKQLELERESYDKQIRYLINESLLYQAKVVKVQEQYEKSSCWKLTFPIRKIGDFLKKCR